MCNDITDCTTPETCESNEYKDLTTLCDGNKKCDGTNLMLCSGTDSWAIEQDCASLSQVCETVGTMLTLQMLQVLWF